MKRAKLMAKRAAVFSAAFCICSSFASNAFAQSGNDNSVTSLNYSQEDTRTVVEIGVKSDPTFSVYSLKNPERVVVEILDCNSNSHITPVQVRNGVIDTAAVSISQSNDYDTCRVILGLEKETTYSVDSTQNAITVAVNGKPRQSIKELENEYAELQRTQREALERAQEIAAREQASKQRIEQLETDYANANARVNQLTQSNKQLETDYANANARVNQLAQSNKQLETDYANANARLNQLAESKKQLETDYANANIRLNQLAESKKQLETDYANANIRLNQLSESKRQLESDFANANARVNQLAQNNRQLESDYANASARVNQLAESKKQLETDYANANARVNQLAQNNRQLESDYANANARANQLESDYANANERLNQLAQSKQQLETDFANANARMNQLAQSKKQLETDFANANARVNQLAQSKQQLETDFANANARANQLAQSKKQLETDYANANARVSQLAQSNKQLETDYANANARASQLAQSNKQLETDYANANARANQLAQSNKQLETDYANANARANQLAQNVEQISAQNSELQLKIAQQNSEMEKLNKEVLAGGAARRKLKALESKPANQLSEADNAMIADLRVKARDGRHALEELNRLKAENETLRAKLNAGAASQAEVQVATTEGSAKKPALADIVSTAMDQPVVSRSTQEIAAAAPLDRRAAAQASIRDLQFKRTPDNDGMQVIVKLSAPVDKVESIDGGSQSSTLRIPGAVLPDSFNKKFDTSAFNQGVRFVDSTQANGHIELIAQTANQTIDSVEQNGDTITWNLRQTKPANTFQAKVDRRQNAMVSAAAPNSTFSTNFTSKGNLKDSPLAKRKITLDINEAEITDLLRLLSDEINTSIVVSPDVKGKITLSLKSVPLDQALDIILRMHDLGMRYEGNVIWIAKAEAFRAEAERALREAESLERMEPLEVRLIPVNYATAGDIQGNIQSLLSSRGSINIDPRTNTLILKDVAANLDAAELLVNNLDTQTPQILIEARIVETQANFAKDLGIQWGGDGVMSAATGNPTGIVFPSSIGIAGGSTSDNNAGTSSSPNFAVNMPASVGTGTGGALGISLGSIGGAINLNIRLSAMETKGFLKIISSPRIMTLDNIQASIQQGTSIPVSVVSAAGAQTSFFDASLNLQVTPHATRDGNIYLKIDISKNEPDFGNTGANGDPSILRKQAHTELLIPDGDTTVIGGIYTRNTSQSLSSVPFFGDIPILGYLFKKQSESDNRTELLIFITPKIINRDASIAASGHDSFIPPVERDSKK